MPHRGSGATLSDAIVPSAYVISVPPSGRDCVHVLAPDGATTSRALAPLPNTSSTYVVTRPSALVCVTVYCIPSMDRVNSCVPPEGAVSWVSRPSASYWNVHDPWAAFV